MSPANNKFNLLVRCCQHLAQVIKQRPTVGNTASQISLPYNASITVPLKISYALIPIPKSSQNHSQSHPERYFPPAHGRDPVSGPWWTPPVVHVHHVHQWSTNGWPRIPPISLGRSVPAVAISPWYGSWSMHRAFLWKPQGERCSERCSEWCSEWWWSSYTILYLALMLYGEWWWVSRQVQCLDMFCSNTWKTCNAMESRAKCKDGITS